jgi:hypothetical protein
MGAHLAPDQSAAQALQLFRTARRKLFVALPVVGRVEPPDAILIEDVAPPHPVHRELGGPVEAAEI